MCDPGIKIHVMREMFWLLKASETIELHTKRRKFSLQAITRAWLY